MSAGERRRSRIAARARTIIERDYADSDRCSTKSIARRLGITRPRLCRCYREAFDRTVGEHVRRLRVERAKRLMEREPERLIKEIAADAGFGERSYRTFFNAFKRVAGRSPHEYRRELAAAREQEDPADAQSSTFSA